MVRVVAGGTPESELVAATRRYARLKSTIADLTKESNRARDSLTEMVVAGGAPDETGSLWVHLPEPVEGVQALKRERRVSTSVDQDAAMEILRSKGLESRCTAMVPVIDQDEVVQCLNEGLLSDKELERMFPSKITWALVTSKKG